MNLFRSEEHVRDWPLYDPDSADGTMSLADYATLFGIALFRERLQPDYLLRFRKLTPDWSATLEWLGKTGPFWSAGPPRRSDVARE
jgi:hypothetical protein